MAISRPTAEDALAADHPVALLATAYDLEDGVLLGESLVWMLDGVADPPFATGMSPVVMFPESNHTLTLQVTDSTGSVSTDELLLDVSEESDPTQVRTWFLY